MLTLYNESNVVKLMKILSDDSLEKTHIVYVLKCYGGKHYIGVTKNIFARMRHHFNNQGSLFTKKYKPKELIGYFRVPLQDRVLYEGTIRFLWPNLKTRTKLYPYMIKPSPIFNMCLYETITIPNIYMDINYDY